MTHEEATWLCSSERCQTVDVANHFAQLCFDGGKDFMQKKKKKNLDAKKKEKRGGRNSCVAIV